jgi:Clp amino terminal domain, pathogenicity island component
MFERYTEKARRVIFFARYEASAFGSPSIETEHLLLGFLREYKGISRLLPNVDDDSIRKEIAAATLVRECIPASVDLPLSNESKDVLKYAADEADRLNHRHIGTEHLLLGLLHEKKHFAAQLLGQRGAELEKLRAQIGRSPIPWLPRTYPVPPKGFPPRGRDTVEIHGSPWNVEYVREAVLRCGEYSWHWQKRPWVARDIVVERSRGTLSFDLGLAEDAANFELVKAGWKKEHCSICRWELLESKEDATHGTGYTNGRDWLCLECYEKFFKGPDFFASPYSDIT